MTKPISQTTAILLAHFTNPTDATRKLIHEMDGRSYSASLSAARRKGLLRSRDTFPFSEITNEGRAALAEYRERKTK